jgi:hypothetical protein
MTERLSWYPSKPARVEHAHARVAGERHGKAELSA